MNELVATSKPPVSATRACCLALTLSWTAGCTSSEAASDRVAPSPASQPTTAEIEVPQAAAEAEPSPSADSSEPESQPAAAAPTATPPTAADPPPPRQPPQDAPRVYAKSRNVWVRGRPTYDTQWIGFLWFGNSVKLKSSEPVMGPGCKTWYAIEPRGYVCVDGERATLDPNDPVLRGIFPLGPDPDSPTPHLSYGETAGSEVYPELPTVKHQRAREWDYRFRMKYIEDALAGGEVHDSLVGFDYEPATNKSLLLPELPRNLRMGRKRYIPDSTVAWTREVEHEGRSFLLTDDLTWVPKDRVKPYDPVTFRGLHLGQPEADGRIPELPLAFFRDEQNPKFKRTEAGEFIETGDSYERLSWVALTGKTEQVGEQTFFETKDGQWLDAEQSVIPALRDKTPWGAPMDGSDFEGDAPRGRQTWIDVSVLGGWLLAYEGTRPVFVTLISPGRGGVPARGVPPLSTSATPTGQYKITGKFLTATMVAPNDLVHSAVPWAQNFTGPYALHGAYWHNNWGNKQSGGCVNVSPQDGQWLFHFTEPKIPEGWHGVRWLPKEEPATTFITRR